MAVELATAYISLVPSTRGFAAETNKQVAPEMTKQGGQIGDKMLAGIGKSLKVGAVAVGALAVGGIGTALVKGFSRLDGLDQATAKLSGLGHNAETVESIMQNALASVSGTAFGMDAAAGTAAQLVAAGIAPGQDLERTLKAVADSATIAGVDMDAMGSIFGKVASSGKVQGDVIAQLSDAGVPALSLLADQLGVTAEEASAMASRGEIDFATFQAAMEGGMGGAALASGDTFSGAMDNMGAALGRVGANLLSGIFPQMKDGLGGITDFLGPLEEKATAAGEAFGIWAADVGPKVVEVLKGIGDFGATAFAWVSDNIGLLKTIGAVILGLAAGILVYRGVMALIALPTQIAAAAQLAWNAAMLLNPIGLIVVAIIALVAAIIWVATQTTFFQDVWAAVSAFFIATWTNVSAFFTGLWQGIIAFLSGAVASVSAAIGAALTWIQSIWSAIWSGISAFFGAIWAGIVAFVTGYINTVLSIITTVVGAISAAWSAVWSGISAFFGAIWSGIVAFVTGYINTVLSIITSVIGAISSIWSSVWGGISSFFAGIWGGIVSAVQSFGGFFKSAFDGIAGFVTNAFSGVLQAVKGPINGIIGIVNSAIDSLNGISIAIPDWVPGVGGSNFGLSIPRIPRLATGGIVSRRPGGIMANIGEGRYDEAVVPLSPAFMRSLEGGTGGDTYVQNPFTGEYLLAEVSGIAGRVVTNAADDISGIYRRGLQR